MRLAVVAVALTLLSAAAARAGTYEVFACADAVRVANNSWTVSNDATTKLETGNDCGGSGAYGGLYARDALNVSNAPAAAEAEWSFGAPAGTSIVHVSYSRWFFKEDDDDWQPALRADGTVVETCSIVYPSVDCTSGSSGGQRTSVAFAGADSLNVGVSCAAVAPITCSNGALDHHKVNAVLYGATVTLSDPSSPAISNVGGPLFGGGYLRGSQFVRFDASDNSGISAGRLYVDGAPRATSTYSCDFTYTVPCSAQNGAELVLDTRSVADGSHAVEVAASDAASNEAKSVAYTVVVDNTPPTAPAGLSVDGGDGWRGDNSFSVRWTNPGGQVAPVTAAHYQVCSADGKSCAGPPRTVASSSRIDGISVPSPGEWLLKVWLEDAAGNVDPAQAASAILRFGSPPTTGSSTPPGTPAPLGDAQPVTSDQPRATDPTNPTLAPTLQKPGLHLTSARYARGRLVIRGRTARSARGLLTVSIRTGKRHASFNRRARGGAFRFTLRLRRAPRSVSVRFAETTFFRAQPQTVRVR